VSDSVNRGFEVFTSTKKGNCSVCHSVGEKYALFTDNKFHDIGVGVHSGTITDPDRYAVTHNEADRGKFKMSGPVIKGAILAGMGRSQ